jgi:hypothetical protein
VFLQLANRHGSAPDSYRLERIEHALCAGREAVNVKGDSSGENLFAKVDRKIAKACNV